MAIGVPIDRKIHVDRPRHCNYKKVISILDFVLVPSLSAVETYADNVEISEIRRHIVNICAENDTIVRFGPG